MKYITIFSILTLFILASCINDWIEENQDIVLNIPDNFEMYDIPDEILVDWSPVAVSWALLQVGDVLTDASVDLRADYFNEVESTTLEDFWWIKLIQTVPSLDTPVCTFQTQQLEAAAKKYEDITFITLSNDTPFALQRFCSANSIDNLVTLSDARLREFWNNNSFFLPEFWLLTRSIMVVNENLEILYIEYAEEVTHELNLENALAFLESVRD